MIFSDYTQDDLPNFDAVLENYGVKCAEGIVFEGDNADYHQIGRASCRERV